MTLLIVPVRPGDSNEELRYAIRSWEANLVMPDLQLMVVGHCPTWLDPDWYAEGNKYASLPLAVFDNVRLGAEKAEAMGYSSAIFMNDDFFCLDPVPGVLPVRRHESLAQQTAGFGANISLWWPRSLLLTASWLAEQGFHQTHSYEVHRPLLAQPDGMVEALHRWLNDPKGGMTDVMPQWRTIYGVLNEVEAYPVKDAKLGTNSTGVGTPWVSTSDQSWRRFGRSMINRFQKPSRWER